MVRRPKLSDYLVRIGYMLQHLNAMYGKGQVTDVHLDTKHFSRAIQITQHTWSKSRKLKFYAHIKNGKLTVRALRHQVTESI